MSPAVIIFFFILSFLFLIFLEGGIIYSKFKFLKTFYPQHKMEKCQMFRHETFYYLMNKMSSVRI